MDSVVNQTYNNLEIIVIDDGSDDETPLLLKRYQKKYSIHVIRNDTSLGACRARNQGIELAGGEFIAGLDDDDEWHPDRISELLKNYDDSFACITSNDKMVSASQSVVWHKKKTITLDDLLYSNCVGNQVLVKRGRLLAVGGFNETLEAAQDYDLWIRLCDKFGPIKNVKKPLQNVYHEADIKRISNKKSQLNGYLSVYKKYKKKMNRNQRLYQLYNIRLAQGKISSIFELLQWVPPEKLFKEIKRWIANTYILQ
jgi:glycosyltransferase involved in cell wall biosynthesis